MHGTVTDLIMHGYSIIGKSEKKKTTTLIILKEYFPRSKISQDFSRISKISQDFKDFKNAKSHLIFDTKKYAWLINNWKTWKEENLHINNSSMTYQNLETTNSPEAPLSNSEENNEDKEDPTTVLSSISIKMDDKFQIKKAQPQTFPQYPSRWAAGSKSRRAIGSILWN